MTSQHPTSAKTMRLKIAKSGTEIPRHYHECPDRWYSDMPVISMRIAMYSRR
jgi:hypothetical protein